MPNTPAQFPNIDLPGAEYLSLAPNGTIAIQGRRRKQFPVATVTFLFQNSGGQLPSPNPPLVGTIFPVVTNKPSSDLLGATAGTVMTLRGGTYITVNLAPPYQFDLQVTQQSTSALASGDRFVYVSGPLVPGAPSMLLESNFLPSSGIYIHFFWLTGADLTGALAGLSLANPPLIGDYLLGSPFAPTDRDRLVIGKDIFSQPASSDLSLAAVAPAGAAIARIIYTRLDGFLE